MYIQTVSPEVVLATGVPTERSQLVSELSPDELFAYRKLLGNYVLFASKVAKLARELSILEDVKEHPDYLGSGLSVSAFRMTDDKDGGQYVVRIASTNNTPSVDDLVRAMICATNLPRFERVVAIFHDEDIISYRNGTIITEMMSGSRYDKLSTEEIANITDQHLVELVEAAVQAYYNGIAIDPNPENIFYDAEQGFGIIDYTVTSGVYGLGENAGRIAHSFCGSKLLSNRHGLGSKDYYKEAVKLLGRYKKVVEENVQDDKERQLAVRIINMRIMAAQFSL